MGTPGKEVSRKHLSTRDYLLSRGWRNNEVDIAVRKYGVKGLTQKEATELLGFKALDSGTWFPFNGGYGQLRHDTVADPKYINPKSEKVSPAAWNPAGGIEDCDVVTEGWCDAFFGTQRGKINVAAVAGVSHVVSTLPANGGQTVLFDADGMTNAAVMQQLIKAGLHLRGKIQLIPLECGDHAGCEEFFKAGKTAEDFQALLADAVPPREFLERWLEFLLEWNQQLPKNVDSLDKLYQKIFELAWLCDPDGVALTAKIEKFIQAHSKKWVGKRLAMPAIRTFKSSAEQPYRKESAERQLAERQEAAKAIAEKGSWEVKYCLEPAVTISPTGQLTLAPAGAIAGLMELGWGNELRYRLDFSSFYAYGRRVPGQWERVSDREVKELIQRELDGAGAEGLYGLTPVESSTTLLSQRVAVRDWPTERGLIPFRNGVLRISDNTLQPHDPRYKFTWQLPYDYLPEATCAPIVDWMRWVANEDETVVQLIRACMKAMVLGRTDFQKYLEIIGPGGTGKGTLIRLIQALLGRSNTVSTSLSRIASSRFETSRFMGKRLVFIPDADYNPTAVDVLKQMTGEDYIPWERKCENADYADGFTLEGWVMVATNKEVIASDHTNALFRRRIPIYFNRVVPEGERRSLLEFGPDGCLKGEFAEHLSGLFNWVVTMPSGLMEAYIRTPRQYVGSMAEFQTESLLNSDNLAQWVNDWIVIEPSSWTKVGDMSNLASTCLYSNYVHYCEAANVKPLSLTKFSGALENLLQKQLGIDHTERKRDRARGTGFIGIRLVKTVIRPDGTLEPIESPQTVELTLQGGIDNQEDLLNELDLLRLLNLHDDDYLTYCGEINQLSPNQLSYLYKQIPELRVEGCHAA